jgi:hypothetical protein
MAQQKKEYQKPVLERLVLIPRENVLAACSVPALSASGLWPQLGCQSACLGATIMGPPLP